jgi:hypothetical protein
MWWKFGGGKEKKENEKNLLNVWIKNDVNKKILDEINNTIEIYLKEIALEEVTIDEIIKGFENQYNIKIPKFVINNL